MIGNLNNQEIDLIKASIRADIFLIESHTFSSVPKNFVEGHLESLKEILDKLDELKRGYILKELENVTSSKRTKTEITETRDVQTAA